MSLKFDKRLLVALAVFSMLVLIPISAAGDNNQSAVDVVEQIESEEVVQFSVDVDVETSFESNITGETTLNSEFEDNKIYVNQSNPDAGNGSVENPYKSLGDAIDANNAGAGGNEIIVYNGTYVGHYTFSKDVTITGNGGVVLDVDGYYLSSYGSPNYSHLTLNGVTITNQGKKFIFQCLSYLELNNCIVENNVGGDGIIENTVWDIKIINSTFRNLKYVSGSAPFSNTIPMEIANSVFSNLTYASDYLLLCKNSELNGNFWGVNDISGIISSSSTSAIRNWIVAIPTLSTSSISKGDNATVTVKFFSTTDGVTYTELTDKVLPEVTLSLTANIGDVIPGTVTLTNNVGNATYLALAAGDEQINLSSGSEVIYTINQVIKKTDFNIYVDANASSGGNGSKEAPFNNIADAIEFSENEDGNYTIVISAGNYTLSNALITKSLTIQSVNQGVFITSNNANILTIRKGANVTLKSLIFENATDAIVSEVNSTLAILDSIFTNNSGAIISNGKTTISNSKFANNKDIAIDARDGSLDISYSMILDDANNMIKSKIPATANNNFWGPNVKPDIENVTADGWVVVNATLNASSVVYCDTPYEVLVRFISNDGRDLTESLPDTLIQTETTLGVIDDEVLLRDNMGIAHYIVHERGSGEISIKLNNVSLQTIAVTSKDMIIDTTTVIVAVADGFNAIITVNVNASCVVNESTIELTFNNQNKTAPVVDGRAVFKFNNLDAGRYNITANYVGSALFGPSNATGSLNIARLQAYVKPIYKMFVFNYGHLYQFTLKDRSSNPIAGRTVLFSIHGKYYSAVTNSNGMGQIQITPKMLITAGKFFTRLTFRGDGQYKPHSYPIWITALKETTKLSVKSASYKISAKNKLVTATLKDSKNKAMKNKVVYINVNGKTVKATTNAKGVATFKLSSIKFTKAGKYAFTVTFKEDNAYKGITGKGTLTITS